KNSFVTDNLTMSDIQNKAEYEGEGMGVSFGSSVSFDGKLTPSGTGAGVGDDSGSANSTTQSGISGIAGNKNVRTGDKETGIAKIFDANKVQKEINAKVQITQIFSQQAGKAVENYVGSKRQEL